MNEGQVDDGEQKNRVIFMPCSGIPNMGIPSAHVYQVVIGKTIKFFMPADDAINYYTNPIISGSSTICPDCAKILRNLAKRKR